MNRLQGRSGSGELRKDLASTVAMAVPGKLNEVRMQQLIKTFAVLASIEAMEFNLQAPQPPKQIAAGRHDA